MGAALQQLLQGPAAAAAPPAPAFASAAAPLAPAAAAAAAARRGPGCLQPRAVDAPRAAAEAESVRAASAVVAAAAAAGHVVLAGGAALAAARGRRRRGGSPGPRSRRRRLADVAARAAVAPEDVVLVYDPLCDAAAQVHAAVESENAMAPRRVAYCAVPSSDRAAVERLASHRGVVDPARLHRPQSATAVLPSGAVIEELEQDPGPLLRELRYRTCLEQPPPAERAELERRFWEPLRALRAVGEGWWRAPAATEALSRQLDEQGFVLIDGFLPDVQVRRLRACAEGLYQSSAMASGATTGGSSRVGLPHRGDFVRWIGYGGSSEVESTVSELSSCVAEAIGVLQVGAEHAGNAAVASALGGVRWCSEMMLTCYPGESRARYFRHTDNSSGNGRLLTGILYLNEGWREDHGGELRLFHPGEQNLRIKHEVEPIWNRLILFWSDSRCPHEVLSACQDRYAATVWFYDKQNPSIPLFPLEDVLGARSLAAAAAAALPAVDDADRGHAEVAEGRPRAASGASAPPPPAGAQPPAGARPPPVTVGGARPPPAPAAAPAAARAAPVLFYDGADAAAAELAASLPAGAARAVDVRAPGAAEALREAAGERLAASLCELGPPAFSAKAGAAILVLPDGSVLQHAERDRWMLQYELDYWGSVAFSAATKERVRRNVLGPLGDLRAGAGGGAAGSWWTSQPAVGAWSAAIAKESFAVFDDFLPPAAAAALAAAMERMRSSMVRGRTDSELSASGRGDEISWANPADVPEMGPLVECLNGVVSALMELPDPGVQARLARVSALSDAQFAVFPGDSAENARYIRHVDNEDGRNGRLLTCTYYLNEGWDASVHGGEIRLFEPDQRSIKADIAPVWNRLVCFFSDSSVPHEVRRAHRERRAITIWYLDQEAHLAYHR